MSKYGNRVDYVGDKKFDSIKEARYFLFLREQEKNGQISNLRRQVPFTLLPPIKGKKVIQLKTKTKEVEYTIQDSVRYIADFVYTDKQGKEIIVDVKSEATRKDKVYVIKKKMMRALLKLIITEV